MFYNPHRLHSYLNYKSPNRYGAEMSQVQSLTGVVDFSLPPQATAILTLWFSIRRPLKSIMWALYNSLDV